MKRTTKKTYKPRVIVRGNTGSRVMKTKIDKANTRQSLKLALKKEYI